MKNYPINYGRLANAQLFYLGRGYQNVETPWLVSARAVGATLPPECQPYTTSFGVLVGSGEQGFLQCMLDGVLNPGKSQTTTPCFRDEKILTEMCRQTFVKLELIWYQPEDPQAAYSTVINDALACFFEIADIGACDVVRTEQGVDIFYSGIELGSYGVRQMGGHVWVYGTGLAEPRFSLAIRPNQDMPGTPVRTQQDSVNPCPSFVL